MTHLPSFFKTAIKKKAANKGLSASVGIVSEFKIPNISGKLNCLVADGA